MAKKSGGVLLRRRQARARGVPGKMSKADFKPGPAQAVVLGFFCKNIASIDKDAQVTDEAELEAEAAVLVRLRNRVELMTGPAEYIRREKTVPHGKPDDGVASRIVHE